MIIEFPKTSFLVDFAAPRQTPLPTQIIQPNFCQKSADDENFWNDIFVDDTNQKHEGEAEIYWLKVNNYQ